MSWQWIDPLIDPRWPALVERHERASVFHTRGWLEALKRTYGYEPVALAIGEPGGPLRSGVALCRIRSWLTGKRLVSLPFSDHCDLLIDDGDQGQLMDALREERKQGRWKYVELRTSHGLSESGFSSSDQYCLHRLDLRPDSKALLASFHKSHVVRKIRRSEREKLVYEEGSSDALLRSFYTLLVQTRRRHGLPPQPLAWFRTLLDCLPAQARVRVAFKNAAPVASILTLCERDVMVYKYGASNPELHALGGMHFLLWRTIQDARERGCVTLDLGRSEVENKGLVEFKDHWGATRYQLPYWRHPRKSSGRAVAGRLSDSLARRVFSFVPDKLRIVAGKTLYRHIG